MKPQRPGEEPQATTAVRAVKDMDSATQAAVELFLGRPLSADQKIIVTVLDLNDATAEEHREQAWRTIREILDHAAANTKELAPGEFDAALQEAMEDARPRLKQ